MSQKKLKYKIIDILESQGFVFKTQIHPPSESKIEYKNIQAHAKTEQINLHKNFILKESRRIKNYLINGYEIDPKKINLELREVKTDTIEEIIFKWWNLMWWSVPYQRPYGRQMRFLIWDNGHNTPFGLIGLQSPILKMSVRDNYLKIPKSELDLWVNKSMQAQRLGALPPYNKLLGGKMVALSITSNELRQAYQNKYINYKTELLNRLIPPELLFITTTSAFGKSSIYNRLKYNGEPVALSLGFTKGAGSFHIPESLYTEILSYLKSKNINISTSFGSGPSRKIKLLYTAFRLLKLPDYSYHNLQREFFLFPLADNVQEVIHNNINANYYDRPIDDLVEYWKGRWCINRATTHQDWKGYKGLDFVNKLLKESFKEEYKQPLK